MTISEVSQKYGISADTLRYYEKAGLIPPVNRKENGIRDYTETDCGCSNMSSSCENAKT